MGVPSRKMPLLTLLLTGVTLAACLSPLLTFATLFQLKEWRLDRLLEHLRRDGWIYQAFGKIRPPLVVIYLLLFWAVAIYEYKNYLAGNPVSLIADAFDAWLTILWISLLGALSIIQIVMRRQKKPVWTIKAILIVAVSITFTIIILHFTLQSESSWPILILPPPLLVLLQPFFVLAAWMILKPIDAILKNRVMDRARALRASMKNVTVIGIAGSVGKTTTKELIAHVLQDLKPLTTPAHVNTEMGVAQWLLQKASAHTSLIIVEMGAYAKGEIKLLCSIAQPTIGVMTALGSDHLALFGSEEAIVEANGELIASLPKNGHAFFYGENDGCKKLAAQAPCAVTLTGIEDLIPTNIVETQQHLSFTIGNMPFAVPLPGRHNLHNTLLAIGAARHLGITDNRIKELLKTFRPPAHTFNVRTERGVLLLDDTYNISPLSLRAALDWVADQNERPRILLTSGLQETGKGEERFLQELGAYAKGKIERVIFTNPHGTKTFSKAFQSPVEILEKETTRVDSGSVLLAVGRMPLSTIQRLLPPA